jgi:AmmeMemoRadiSam system protein B
MIGALLPDAGDRPEPWPAVLVPHAGLRFSGDVAAAVYRRVAIPDAVIILGPKHSRAGVEWAVAPHEAWALPGATVTADPTLARQLVAAIPGLHMDARAHEQEHCIEVQLPFLARLAPQTRVVGIVLGAGNLDRCRQFASGLAEVLRRQTVRPLLVISSDLNHYASDVENRRLDAIALAALERLDPAEIYETLVQRNISMCGLLPAIIVLETLRQMGTLQTSQRVAYATSADVTGDKGRVVGYAGMLFG